MLIDWFTVGAQVLNFIILVWLLRRFLYKPILHAIDAREKRIADELADADAKKTEAQAERTTFQRKNDEFDKQRTALLRQATNDADVERRRLLDQARATADALGAKRETALRNDARELRQAIARQTRTEVFSIARKALTELASTSLEERIGEVFVQRLREMDDETKEGIAAARSTASEPALVRSAFDLQAPQRQAIQQALNDIFATEVHIRFDVTPDLIGGVELATNGQKVAWSIDHYLGSLEKSLSALVGARFENGANEHSA